MKYKIVDISEESAHYDDKGALLGLVGRYSSSNSTTPDGYDCGSFWSDTPVFDLPLEDCHFYFFGVKVEEVHD